jgi:hypothetical protein
MKNFDEFYNAILEMALTDFKKIGKWDDNKSRHGYDKASVGILNSDVGVRKIQDAFNKVKLADFNLYFIKQPKAWTHEQIGKTTPEFIKKAFDLEVGKDIKNPDNGEISIIFTNNAAAERTPLTPWTIAHRIGHAFYSEKQIRRSSSIEDHIKNINNTFKYILDDCYQYTNKKNVYLGSNDYIFRDFIENIGTFRSARLKKLPRTFEFFYECFAQWLLSNGNLKFNDFPKVLKSSNRKAWGKDTGRSYELVDEDLADNYKSDLIYAFENAFRELLESNLDNISIM